MAQKKKRGLIDRLFMGSEKSDGYARASLPSSRWELFWDIFKGRFSKLVIINLLLDIFLIPTLLFFFFKQAISVSFGAMYPFSQCFGTGYGADFSMIGYAESIALNIDSFVYILTPVVFVIASIGVAGAAYVIRNIVWTEGVFVANDFWKGIKQNAKQLMLIAISYSLVFYFCMVSIALCNQYIVVNQELTWIFKVSLAVVIILLVIATIVTLHMITMSVTYDLKFRHLLKNSILFTIAFIPQNLLFLALCAIPFLLILMGGMMSTLGVLISLVFGGSFLLLIWTNYSHWIYDKHINDHVKGAKKNKGIYEKIKHTNSQALKQYKQQVEIAQRNSLNSRPIKPITDDELKIADLPSSFSRKDLVKLVQSKEAIYEDHKNYVEQHINDPEFLPEEKDEKQLKAEAERQKRIEQAKKALSKRKK